MVLPPLRDRVGIPAKSGVVGAESVLRAMVDDRTDTPRVAMDLTRVHLVNDVGRRMLLEGVRRLVLDDREVTLVDPDAVLDDPAAGDGIRPRVAASVHELTTH